MVYISNINCEAIRARIALKFGECGKKIPIEGTLHRRSHSIPLRFQMTFEMYLSMQYNIIIEDS